MKKSTGIFLYSGLLSAALFVGGQNIVHADATNTTTASETATQTAPVEAPTAVTNATANTDADATAAPTTDAQADNTSADTTTQATADTTTANSTQDSQTSVTPIKNGVVTTNKVTYLVDKEGKSITNRALMANTDWITDKQLSIGAQKYDRVSTYEYADANDVKLSYGYADKGSIRVTNNGAPQYNRGLADYTYTGAQNLAENSMWKYNRKDEFNGVTYYQIANNLWINSNDATTAPAYQNPSGWLQIQDTQIKQSETPGYDLYNGVEGIKTWLVRRYFGYSNAHTIYDGNVANSVRGLQSRVGLPVTGTVNLATWQAMGFSEQSWYDFDAYVAPLQTNATSTRSYHIEAMINQAYKYLGQPWISGAASMPGYGVDCSGLVTQALYASGVDSAPISNIQHASPGHEWNSRDYWADGRLPQISFNSRQRGDLIFFADPSTGVVWHVGILLDPHTMIESWPYAVQVHSIYSGRGTIVGVKRVFH